MLTCTAIDGTQSMIRVVRLRALGRVFWFRKWNQLKEAAIALAPTQLMSWATEEVDRQIERQPLLASALCEYFGHYNRILRDRIVTTATQNTGTRVKVALVEFAHGIGKPQIDGATE